MKYSNIITVNGKSFVIRSGEWLNSLIVNRNEYLQNTEDFRYSLAVALAKLRSLLESPLVCQGNTLIPETDIFSGIDLSTEEGQLDWYAVECGYSLPTSPCVQAIKDGLDAHYGYVTRGLEFVTPEGTFAVNGRQIGCSDIAGNPSEVFSRYVGSISEAIQGIIVWLGSTLGAESRDTACLAPIWVWDRKVKPVQAERISVS